LAGEGGAEVDFLAEQTQTAAAGDDDSLVVEWIVRLGNA
jgi:hypothetical protein